MSWKSWLVATAVRSFAFVVTGVLRGLRYLDSQPTPRTDHVEACRPRGCDAPSIVEAQHKGKRAEGPKPKRLLVAASRIGTGSLPARIRRVPPKDSRPM